MKTLHFYLTRQVLATLAMTVAVFTFILVIGDGIKEILTFLINGQASLLDVAEAFGLLFPWLLVFALPMGMLAATLLVFGRLSADNEITAVRSSGISLVSLVSPVLILSLLLCALSAWINMDLSPRCRVAYKNLANRTVMSLAAGLIPEGRYTTISNTLSLYVERIDGTNLYNIIVWQTSQEPPKEQRLAAERGELSFSNQTVFVTLYNVHTFALFGDKWDPGEMAVFRASIGSRSTNSAAQKPDLTDMTFRQLQDELRELEKRPAEPIPELTPDDQARLKSTLASYLVDPALPIRVQMHREVAFSFACLGFTLVGIPLGIRGHRRETIAGFVIALILAIIYYTIFIVGIGLRTHAELAPHLLMWAPNFLFQAAGAVLLWRANRGT